MNHFAVHLKHCKSTILQLKIKTSALGKTISGESADKSQMGRKYLQKTHLIKTVIQNMKRTLETPQKVNNQLKDRTLTDINHQHAKEDI